MKLQVIISSAATIAFVLGWLSFGGWLVEICPYPMVGPAVVFPVVAAWLLVFGFGTSILVMLTANLAARK